MTESFVQSVPGKQEGPARDAMVLARGGSDEPLETGIEKPVGRIDPGTRTVTPHRPATTSLDTGLRTRYLDFYMDIESHDHGRMLLELAVARGSVQDVGRLLTAGVDPNERGTSGGTVLHDAVRQGHHAVAALLLAAGADWRLHDEHGRRALSADFASVETLHRIRQEYQRLPLPLHDAGNPANDQVSSFVERIERDGMLRIEGLVEPDGLHQMQQEFDTFVRRINRARLFFRKRFSHYDEDEHWRPRHRSYVTNDALRQSPALLEFCCRPLLKDIADRYLRRPANIRRAVGMRYLPSRTLGSEQFGWHHDMEDRQLKLMILLSDVGEKDQYMTYVRGSHNTLHPYARFLRNDLDFDYVSTYLDRIEVVKLTGQAGDVFFFDSNGMHRGNRSRGRVRDAFFVEFTTDQNRDNLWGSQIDRQSLDPAIMRPEHPLAAMLSVVPIWQRPRQHERKRPSWAESLEDPANWI